MWWLQCGHSSTVASAASTRSSLSGIRNSLKSGSKGWAQPGQRQYQRRRSPWLYSDSTPPATGGASWGRSLGNDHLGSMMSKPGELSATVMP